jgi:NAD-specific glutamate dehydrogenase
MRSRGHLADWRRFVALLAADRRRLRRRRKHARLHFFLAAPRARVLAIRREDLQREVASTRGWNDRLRTAPAEHGDAQGSALAGLRRRVSRRVQAGTDPATAVADIVQLGSSRRCAELHCRRPGGARHYTALKLYLREPLVLSAIMPVLEHLGLRVSPRTP